MKFKKTSIAILGTVALTLTNVSQSAVLNFDDLNLSGSTYTSMPDLNYGGFNWDSRWFAGSTSNNSYANTASSGTQYLSNGNSVNDLTISSATLFDFDGAFFGTPTHSNRTNWINITAYDALNNVIGSTGQVNLTTIMTWVNAGFKNVASLTIARDSKWYAMDDFTYNSSVSEVPIPAAAFLFAPALLGFMGLRRKAKIAH